MDQGLSNKLYVSVIYVLQKRVYTLALKVWSTLWKFYRIDFDIYPWSSYWIFDLRRGANRLTHECNYGVKLFLHTLNKTTANFIPGQFHNIEIEILRLSVLTNHTSRRRVIGWARLPTMLIRTCVGGPWASWSLVGSNVFYRLLSHGTLAQTAEEGETGLYTLAVDKW